VPAEEAKRYEFILTNVLETLDTSVEDHRKLMAEQQEAAKHKKLTNAKPSGSKSE